MAGFTDSAEVATLDAWFGSQVLGPATWYLALFTTAAGDAGTGGIEVSGNGYSRLAVTNNPANFPSGNPKANASTLRWPTSTGAWGTPVQVGFFTASTGGTSQVLADIPANKRQNIDAANQAFEVPVGDLSLALD